MELAKDTRDRIFAAADSLYEQAGRAAFPTVDAVRKVARVNMNDASAGMKEWRRAQTAQAAPVAVQVPEAVQQASSAALASLWKEAQELANESLRAAQAGWDADIDELSARLHRTSGGSSETELKEFTVMPAGFRALCRVVMTVTPVANRDNARLYCCRPDSGSISTRSTPFIAAPRSVVRILRCKQKSFLKISRGLKKKIWTKPLRGRGWWW